MEHNESRETVVPQHDLYKIQMLKNVLGKSFMNNVDKRLIITSFLTGKGLDWRTIGARNFIFPQYARLISTIFVSKYGSSITNKIFQIEQREEENEEDEDEENLPEEIIFDPVKDAERKYTEAKRIYDEFVDSKDPAKFESNSRKSAVNMIAEIKKLSDELNGYSKFKEVVELKTLNAEIRDNSDRFYLIGKTYSDRLHRQRMLVFRIEFLNKLIDMISFEINMQKIKHEPVTNDVILQKRISEREKKNHTLTLLEGTIQNEKTSFESKKSSVESLINIFKTFDQYVSEQPLKEEMKFATDAATIIYSLVNLIGVTEYPKIIDIMEICKFNDSNKLILPYGEIDDKFRIAYMQSAAQYTRFVDTQLIPLHANKIMLENKRKIIEFNATRLVVIGKIKDEFQLIQQGGVFDTMPEIDAEILRLNTEMKALELQFEVLSGDVKVKEQELYNHVTDCVKRGFKIFTQSQQEKESEINVVIEELRKCRSDKITIHDLNKKHEQLYLDTYIENADKELEKYNAYTFTTIAPSSNVDEHMRTLKNLVALLQNKHDAQIVVGKTPTKTTKSIKSLVKTTYTSEMLKCHINQLNTRKQNIELELNEIKCKNFFTEIGKLKIKQTKCTHALPQTIIDCNTIANIIHIRVIKSYRTLKNIHDEMNRYIEEVREYFVFDQLEQQNIDDFEKLAKELKDKSKIAVDATKSSKMSEAIQKYETLYQEYNAHAYAKTLTGKFENKILQITTMQDEMMHHETKICRISNDIDSIELYIKMALFLKGIKSKSSQYDTLKAKWIDTDKFMDATTFLIIEKTDESTSGELQHILKTEREQMNAKYDLYNGTISGTSIPDETNVLIQQIYGACNDKYKLDITSVHVDPATATAFLGEVFKLLPVDYETNRKELGALRETYKKVDAHEYTETEYEKNASELTLSVQEHTTKCGKYIELNEQLAKLQEKQQKIILCQNMKTIADATNNVITINPQFGKCDVDVSAEISRQESEITEIIAQIKTDKTKIESKCTELPPLFNQSKISIYQARIKVLLGEIKMEVFEKIQRNDEELFKEVGALEQKKQVFIDNTSELLRKIELCAQIINVLSYRTELYAYNAYVKEITGDFSTLITQTKTKIIYDNVSDIFGKKFEIDKLIGEIRKIDISIKVNIDVLKTPVDISAYDDKRAKREYPKQDELVLQDKKSVIDGIKTNIGELQKISVFTQLEEKIVTEISGIITTTLVDIVGVTVKLNEYDEDITVNIEKYDDIILNNLNIYAKEPPVLVAAPEIMKKISDVDKQDTCKLFATTGVKDLKAKYYEFNTSYTTVKKKIDDLREKIVTIILAKINELDTTLKNSNVSKYNPTDFVKPYNKAEHLRQLTTQQGVATAFTDAYNKLELLRAHIPKSLIFLTSGHVYESLDGHPISNYTTLSDDNTRNITEWGNKEQEIIDEANAALTPLLNELETYLVPHGMHLLVLRDMATLADPGSVTNISQFSDTVVNDIKLALDYVHGLDDKEQMMSDIKQQTDIVGKGITDGVRHTKLMGIVTLLRSKETEAITKISAFFGKLEELVKFKEINIAEKLKPFDLDERIGLIKSNFMQWHNAAFYLRRIYYINYKLNPDVTIPYDAVREPFCNTLISLNSLVDELNYESFHFSTYSTLIDGLEDAKKKYAIADVKKDVPGFTDRVNIFGKYVKQYDEYDKNVVSETKNAVSPILERCKFIRQICDLIVKQYSDSKVTKALIAFDADVKVMASTLDNITYFTDALNNCDSDMINDIIGKWHNIISGKNFPESNVLEKKDAIKKYEGEFNSNNAQIQTDIGAINTEYGKIIDKCFTSYDELVALRVVINESADTIIDTKKSIKWTASNPDPSKEADTFIANLKRMHVKISEFNTKKAALQPLVDDITTKNFTITKGLVTITSDNVKSIDCLVDAKYIDYVRFKTVAAGQFLHDAIMNVFDAFFKSKDQIDEILTERSFIVPAEDKDKQVMYKTIHAKLSRVVDVYEKCRLFKIYIDDINNRLKPSTIILDINKILTVNTPATIVNSIKENIDDFSALYDNTPIDKIKKYENVVQLFNAGVPINKIEDELKCANRYDTLKGSVTRYNAIIDKYNDRTLDNFNVIIPEFNKKVHTVYSNLSNWCDKVNINYIDPMQLPPDSDPDPKKNTDPTNNPEEYLNGEINKIKQNINGQRAKLIEDIKTEANGAISALEESIKHFNRQVTEINVPIENVPELETPTLDNLKSIPLILSNTLLPYMSKYILDYKSISKSLLRLNKDSKRIGEMIEDAIICVSLLSEAYSSQIDSGAFKTKNDNLGTLKTNIGTCVVRLSQLFARYVDNCRVLILECATEPNNIVKTSTIFTAITAKVDEIYQEVAKAFISGNKSNDFAKDIGVVDPIKDVFMVKNEEFKTMIPIMDHLNISKDFRIYLQGIINTIYVNQRVKQVHAKSELEADVKPIEDLQVEFAQNIATWDGFNSAVNDVSFNKPYDVFKTINKLKTDVTEKLSAEKTARELLVTEFSDIDAQIDIIIGKITVTDVADYNVVAAKTTINGYREIVEGLFNKTINFTSARVDELINKIIPFYENSLTYLNMNHDTLNANNELTQNISDMVKYIKDKLPPPLPADIDTKIASHNVKMEQKKKECVANNTRNNDTYAGVAKIFLIAAYGLIGTTKKMELEVSKKIGEYKTSQDAMDTLAGALYVFIDDDSIIHWGIKKLKTLDGTVHFDKKFYISDRIGLFYGFYKDVHKQIMVPTPPVADPSDVIIRDFKHGDYYWIETGGDGNCFYTSILTASLFATVKGRYENKSFDFLKVFFDDVDAKKYSDALRVSSDAEDYNKKTIIRKMKQSLLNEYIIIQHYETALQDLNDKVGGETPLKYVIEDDVEFGTYLREHLQLNIDFNAAVNNTQRIYKACAIFDVLVNNITPFNIDEQEFITRYTKSNDTIYNYLSAPQFTIADANDFISMTLINGNLPTTNYNLMRNIMEKYPLVASALYNEQTFKYYFDNIKSMVDGYIKTTYTKSRVNGDAYAGAKDSGHIMKLLLEKAHLSTLVCRSNGTISNRYGPIDNEYNLLVWFNPGHYKALIRTTDIAIPKALVAEDKKFSYGNAYEPATKSGGAASPYYRKYLKYKQKYIELSKKKRLIRNQKMK